MERKTWPYMAGILDSEGSICIRQEASGVGKTGLIITVGNTDIRLMKWIIDNIGGTFSKRGNKRGYAKDRGTGYLYHWTVPGGKKEWFLRGILPFVVLKKEQAKLALEYVTIGTHWDTAQRNRMSLQCKQLNHSHPVFFADRPSQAADINAYAAGMIDGDGSLFAGRANSQVNIKVVSRAFCTTRWFLAHFGGRFATKLTKDNHPYYEWHLSGRRNKELMLLRLLPYLELKKKQAQLLLELIRISGERGVQDVRREIVEECSALNNPIRESVTTDTQKDSSSNPRHSLNIVSNHESERVGTHVS